MRDRQVRPRRLRRRAIVNTPVPPDAVSFDGERIGIEAIRAEDEYAGTRASLHAFLAPVLESLRRGTKRDGTWRAGGPWR